MTYYSMREAAKKLGIPHTTLATYVQVGKIPAPNSVITGKTTTQIWTEAEIENVRQFLPKIANGRKMRYRKKQPASSSQKPAKAKGKTKSKKKK
jgi:predicted site-specific integrase-resolvase